MTEVLNMCKIIYYFCVIEMFRISFKNKNFSYKYLLSISAIMEDFFTGKEETDDFDFGDRQWL